MQDTTILTEDELEAICKRAEKATPGPWHWRKCYELHGVHWAICNAESDARHAVASLPLISVNDYTPPAIWEQNPDVQFVAAARQDIPRLLATLDRYKAECLRLESLIVNDEGTGWKQKADGYKAENERLAAVVEKYPSCADGAKIYPGMEIYMPTPGNKYGDTWKQTIVLTLGSLSNQCKGLETEWFSTRELALAAANASPRRSSSRRMPGSAVT